MPLSPSDYASVAGSFFTLLAAIAAWRSATAADRGAEATAKATKTQLLVSLLNSYSSDEMLDAMLILRAWTNSHGERSADQFRRLRQDDYANIRSVDQARRRASHFFQNIYTLRTAGFLEDSDVRLVATKGQVEFFREVIEPLEAAIGANYDRSSFEYFGGLYGIQPGVPPLANPKAFTPPTAS